MDGYKTACSVEEAFVRYAEHLADVVGATGWDQPAMLFAIGFGDGVPQESPDGVDGYMLSLQIAQSQVLDCHPADALVGVHAPDGSIAVAVAMEAWVHHPDRIAAGTDDLAPSAYEDSIEVRIVHLIVRDGTEVLVQRPRTNTIGELLCTGVQHGLVPESLRRIIGRPSQPMVPPAGISQMRARIITTLLFDVVSATALSGHEAVTWALDAVAAQRDDLYLETALHYGLFEDTWDAAVAAAERHRSRRKPRLIPIPYNDDVDRFLGWADGDMWGHLVQEALLPRTAIVCAIEEFRCTGLLTDAHARRIIEIADLPPAESTEPF
jgi:hypothetical protein